MDETTGMVEETAEVQETPATPAPADIEEGAATTEETPAAIVEEEAPSAVAEEAPAEAVPEALAEAAAEPVPETAPWLCLNDKCADAADEKPFSGPASIEAARSAGAPVLCPTCGGGHVIYGTKRP